MLLVCVGDVAIVNHEHFKTVWPLPDKQVTNNDARILFNWELPFGDAVNPIPRTSGRRYIGHRDGVQVIRDWAPGFATLANNHILDAGEHGLRETLEVLRELGFTLLGAGFSQTEIKEPIIWDGPEGKLGILNWVFAETHPEWNVIPGPNCWPGMEVGSQIIRELKKQVDWVLVVPHWSDEWFPYPTPEDRVIARGMIEAGADMVIGHHSHVVRGTEIVHGKPIYYSLGNFYFSEIRDPQGNLVSRPVPRTREALVLRVTFERGKNPHFEASSYWQNANQTGVDRLGRAVKRMKKVSRPFTETVGVEYASWYKTRRAFFNRWEYRLNFSLWEKGLKGTLQYPFVFLKRRLKHVPNR